MKQRWLLILVSLALVVGVVGFALVGVTRAAPNATCTWTGATDSLWTTPTNWSGCTGGGAPVASDDVLLDNSTVVGSYTVNLPTGAVTVAIHRLTITPSAGNTITLVLPSGNTANPAGFIIGDNTVNTDDIILNNGAVLQNSTGAPSGANGIEVNSTSNGTVRINNGGRYIHNTTRSTAGIAPRLSTVLGTETGIFEYDSPGTSSVTISAINRNYGTLILTRSAGASTYTSSGSTGPLTVRGNFTINTGVTYNSTMTSFMNVGGNWTNNGAFTTTTNPVAFNGTSEQTIGGSNVTAFNNLVISSTAKVIFPSANILTVAGTMTVNPGAVLTQTATINNGSFNFLIISDTLNNNKFRGVDVSSLNNLGAVTATLVVTTTGGCTSTGIGSPAYATRCYRITPQYPNNTATVKLWALSSELNGLTVDTVVPYHYSGGSWTLLTNVVTGTAGSYTFAQGDTTSFSPFLMGNTAAAPTAVTLTTFSGNTPSNDGWIAVTLLAAAGLLAGGWVLRRRTQA
jgi:hypothetical protein